MNDIHNVRKKILEAALKEFAELGFSGARVDRIAKKSGANKAMVYYYFNSKENLYEEVVEKVILEYLEHLKKIFIPGQDPEKFLNELPKLMLNFFHEKLEFLKIVGHELLKGEGKIRRMLTLFFEKGPHGGPRYVKSMVKKWYDEGLIIEPEPDHFILNILSLCIFSLLAREVVAGIFNIRETDREFLEKRVASVCRVLKQGMLT